eukprot:365335-Chlamydomonas_euryale.AAC.1
MEGTRVPGCLMWARRACAVTELLASRPVRLWTQVVHSRPRQLRSPDRPSTRARPHTGKQCLRRTSQGSLEAT